MESIKFIMKTKTKAYSEYQETGKFQSVCSLVSIERIQRNSKIEIRIIESLLNGI